MDRLACVNVAALPLQILLQVNPAWASQPACVVEDDKPNAAVLYVNTRARRAGVRPGLRYATALAIARDLHAGTVAAAQVEQQVRLLADRLRRFTPHVEPSPDRPGIFWLDAQGLERLFKSLHAWADGIRADLRAIGMHASMAVGFSRFGTYALAASQRETLVAANILDERTLVEHAPLARIDLEPQVLERLQALGVDTVGAFLRLPPGGIRARFGATTEALYQLATGQRWSPLVPVAPEERYENSVDFDYPDSQVDRLIFVVKRLLDGLVPELARRGKAAAGVALTMTLDDRGRSRRTERVRPAAPTLDVAQLLMLIRLRLDTLQLTAGIVTLALAVEACPASADQRRLFLDQSRRDTEGANQAFARIRAECGDQSVVRARLCNAHLPAARFTWEPLEQVALHASPRVVAARPRVRRIYETAVALALGSGLRASGSGGQSPGPNAQSLGPYLLSGAWWRGQGVARDYYFVPTADGEMWWMYYDRRRDRYFLQGQVE